MSVREKKQDAERRKSDWDLHSEGFLKAGDQERQGDETPVDCPYPAGTREHEGFMAGVRDFYHEQLSKGPRFKTRFI